MFYIADLALQYKKPIYSSSIGSIEQRYIMILGILWCPIFTPLVILLGEIKMRHLIFTVLFLLQVCPVFTPNCGVTMGHL